MLWMFILHLKVSSPKDITVRAVFLANVVPLTITDHNLQIANKLVYYTEDFRASNAIFIDQEPVQFLQYILNFLLPK